MWKEKPDCQSRTFLRAVDCAASFPPCFVLYFENDSIQEENDLLFTPVLASQIIAWSLQLAPEPTVPGKFNQFELYPWDELYPALL